MVKACARLDVLDAFGRTPIIVAGTTQNDKVLRALVETDRVLSRDLDGRTINAKQRAIYSKKELWKAISIRDDFGETALSLFVKLRWFNGVEILLNAHAEPNKHGAGGIPPLLTALVPPDPALIRALLKRRANPNRCRPDKTVSSPLELAIKHRCIAAIRSLVSAKADATNSMFQAARGNRPGIIREMLIHKASVNVRKKRGRMPLHIASSSGSDEAIITLIRAKADVNAKDDIGWTPEAHYARENYLTPWQDLVDEGAHGFIKDSEPTLALCDDDTEENRTQNDEVGPGGQAAKTRYTVSGVMNAIRQSTARHRPAAVVQQRDDPYGIQGQNQVEETSRVSGDGLGKLRGDGTVASRQTMPAFPLRADNSGPGQQIVEVLD
eukprot:GEMP01030518.1.p1 GENE.GEMP01030518.1~~GEMP01030518.1.p1  ORF type:complete len:382 (+),score=67.78 GEMP01030518.1:418-1563(+)